MAGVKRDRIARSFIDQHEQQLQSCGVPRNLWKDLDSFFLTQSTAEEFNTGLYRERDIQKTAPTTWTLRYSEDLATESKVFVFDHVCVCDAHTKTKQEISTNSALLETLWELFDLETSLPENIKTSHRASQQIDAVMRVTNVKYNVAVNTLKSVEWSTQEAITKIRNNQVEGELDILDLVHFADVYNWKVDLSNPNNLIIVIPVPAGTRKEDIRCRLSIKNIEFFVGDKLIIKGELQQLIEVNSSTWFFRDSTSIELHVSKRVSEAVWTEFLKGETCKAYEAQYAPLLLEQRVELIMMSMQTYFAQSYVIASAKEDGSLTQKMVWFILDRFGTALNFTTQPFANVACKVFIHIPTNTSYSISWPLVDIPADTPFCCTRTSKTKSALSRTTKEEHF